MAVMKNKTYMAFMCALTGLFFVVTGFQIWCPKYLELVCNLKKS